MIRKFAVWAVVVGAFGPSAKAQEAAFETEADLVYRTVDGQDLALDLARPTEGEGPFPAIVAIHGGAWRAGNRADLRDLIVKFAKHGYVAVSPSYRFCPEHPFPAQVHDVKAAVHWVRDHAEEYRIDPNRIGGVGFSAGGHLALMLGLTGPEDGLEGDAAEGAPSSRVRAVVNYFGPSDLAADDISEMTAPLRDDFIGGPLADHLDEAKAASPLTYVSEGDAPVLTFQGTEDPLVSPLQATALGAAMTEAGVDGRVELLIGDGHGFGEPELSRTLRVTLEFFDRYLKGEGEVPAYLKD